MIDFIINYEKKSLYINFINEEGYKYHIKDLYEEINNNEEKLNDKDFKSISELRNFFLTNKNFEYFYFNSENKLKLKKEMKIIEKKVNYFKKDKSNHHDEIKKSFLLNYHHIKEFYIGPKANIVKKFFEQIDYEKLNANERFKYFNEYIKIFNEIIN